MANRIMTAVNLAAIALFLVAGTSDYTSLAIFHDGSRPTCAVATAAGDVCIEDAAEIQGAASITGNVTLGGTLTGTATGLGWTIVSGANTACNTTCGAAACVFGFNDVSDAETPVECDDATADLCVCAGSAS